MGTNDLDEQKRLARLKSFAILDTLPEEVFDRLTELAAHICETPIAVLTLIDENRQWFKSTYGLDVRETERAISFCTHAVSKKAFFLVPDSLQDPMFQESPLVVGPPYIRFYAGTPLFSADGLAIGTLAVIDRVPRALSEIQRTALEMLAGQCMLQIEMRRQRGEIQRLVAEQEKVRQQLQRRDEHLRQAQQIAGIGSWECHDGVLECSEEVFRIFGIAPEPTPPSFNRLLERVCEGDRPHWQDAHQQALAGTSNQLDYEICLPDGERRHVQENIQWRTDSTGISFLSGTVQDITAQHRAQEQMRLLQACVARVNDIVMITDAGELEEPGPRILFVNDAFERTTGYKRAEVIGRSPRFLQGEKTQLSELKRIRLALEKGESVSAELINYRKNGELFWNEIDIAPVTDMSGRVTQFAAVQRDVTERKQRTIELAYAIRAMQMLTHCNEALLKIESEQDLLKEISTMAVEVGGYRMAWVGYKLDDQAHSILPMAAAGVSADAEIRDLAQTGISWDENKPNGRGPAGQAIRNRRAVVYEDVMRDATFRPWHPIARKYGFRGLICLPLRLRSEVFGILVLHTVEIRGVAEQEVALLQELADNLAFGINHIRMQNKRRRIESSLLKVAATVSLRSSKEFFEQLTTNMADAVGAAAAFICRHTGPDTARTIAAVVDGEIVSNFEYRISDTPCRMALQAEDWIVLDRLTEQFPDAPCLGMLKAQSCAGRRLVNSAGHIIGSLFVAFRGTLSESALTQSALRIFAARAAAEIERLEADARIQEQASLLDQAQDAISVTELADGITYWNKGAERLFGYSAEDAKGRTKGELLALSADDLSKAVRQTLAVGEWSGELRKRRKDGGVITVDSHWTLVRDAEGMPKSIFVIDTDITRRKHAEQEIENLAFYDPLTQLPNRRLLLDRLAHAMATASRYDSAGALLFIDLDNFKSLNDTRGHHIGDLLLQQVARRLEKCIVRKSDTVARFGGDEFVVLLEELSVQGHEAAAHAERIGEKILAAFTEPFQLDQYQHHSTPSIGVALFDRAHSDMDELLKRADLAMYQAKGSGRNAVRFFDPEMQTIVSTRVALESDLRQGLEREEFSLYYQTQTDQHDQVIGMEALVRWRHPTRGLIMPATFVPFAEETGLILQLGQWVLRAGCRQLAQWAARAETAHLNLGINVSVRQFRHPDFVQQVAEILEETGADASRLKFELTESVLVANLEETIAKMAALKQLGIGFSLDDFGTGYSSLAYLKRLPLDQLKIDRSFVRDVLTDSNDAVIAKTIVALGQHLGLDVIAEGVESSGQRDFLASSGCLAYQGYLFGQPLPAEEIIHA